MTGRRGHRALPHTADVILEAWAPDLASCVEEALDAVVATYVAGGRFPSPDHRVVRVAPGTPEVQLIGALEELIFVLDTAEDVPVGATVTATDDGGLELTFRLAARGRVRGTGAVPKAVSRSDLELRVGPGEVTCRFLVDL